ncbi:hypothetical protein B5X24_HaOG210377 [Helicoverpa armigera]|uniref:Uncharacterized protein n=1 Tax=Helicoverpa armigera TaxID=29058 RepID=A0A2W1BI43_HELAM|nr:uncharacterized protein LOC110381106 [Helicoverpa armigera]PZC72887.1 hypothetical protein B5X24_HaOG210377 [Helicoverpa armigera]
MTCPLKILIFSCFCVFVSTKELHLKGTLETKDKDGKGFMNLFHNQDAPTKNERFARHVQTVTESILEHLLNEIKQEYFSENYNPNSPIPRLIRNLNKEMKRNERNKLMKEKDKRKKVNKKRNKLARKKLKLATMKPL